MKRRKRSGVMLAKPLTEKLLSKMNRCILQPKINGIRCRATIQRYYVGEDKHPEYMVELLSSTSRDITSIHHIIQELKLYAWKHAGPRDLTLDGELYHHGWSHQHLRSVVLRDNPHPEMEEVSYYIFDTINGEKQNDRFLTKNDLDPFSHLRVVQRTLAFRESMESILAFGHDWVYHGYEGVIIRDADGLYECKRSNFLLKWKPKHKEWFRIVGLYPEVSEEGIIRAKLGALELCKETVLMTNLPDHEHFRCGGGRLNHAERRKAWVDLRTRAYSDFKAYIAYPELTERGVPSQPILLKIERR